MNNRKIVELSQGFSLCLQKYTFGVQIFLRLRGLAKFIYVDLGGDTLWCLPTEDCLETVYAPFYIYYVNNKDLIENTVTNLLVKEML